MSYNHRQDWTANNKKPTLIRFTDRQRELIAEHKRSYCTLANFVRDAVDFYIADIESRKRKGEAAHHP